MARHFTSKNLRQNSFCEFQHVDRGYWNKNETKKTRNRLENFS
jgi:hypothetical protein